MLACQFGHAGTVKKLLLAGADREVRGNVRLWRGREQRTCSYSICPLV
jgi:hypothetical protein